MFIREDKEKLAKGLCPWNLSLFFDKIVFCWRLIFDGVFLMYGCRWGWPSALFHFKSGAQPSRGLAWSDLQLHLLPIFTLSQEWTVWPVPSIWVYIWILNHNLTTRVMEPTRSCLKSSRQKFWVHLLPTSHKSPWSHSSRVHCQFLGEGKR